AFPAGLIVAWWVTLLQRRVALGLGRPAGLAVALLAVPLILADQAGVGGDSPGSKAWAQANSRTIVAEARRLNPDPSCLLYVAPAGTRSPPEFWHFVGIHTEAMLA